MITKRIYLPRNKLDLNFPKCVKMYFVLETQNHAPNGFTHPFFHIISQFGPSLESSKTLVEYNLVKECQMPRVKKTTLNKYEA